MPDTHPLLPVALELWAEGVSVITTRPDTSKRPDGNWKARQTTRADASELAADFHPAFQGGIGMITGSVSGRVEMFELEGRAMERFEEFAELANATMPSSWPAIGNGWVEQSPSGGIHWFYRLDDDGQPMPGNTKVARRPATPDELLENPQDKIKVLAETRSEGGFVMLAPSAGHLHKDGQPWQRLSGGPATAPTITLDQRATLHAIAYGLFDEMPAEPLRAPNDAGSHHAATTHAPGLAALSSSGYEAAAGDVTPGDDYERQTSWSEILEPHGWKFLFTRGSTSYWRRPGKDEDMSATTGHAADRNRLYVFSSSTEFEQHEPYTKFGAYALLNHGGNHSAAAKALAGDNFGERAPRQLRAVEPVRTTPDAEIATTAAGTSAAVAPLHQPVLSGHQDQLTDTGNADLVRGAWHGRICYIPSAATWAAWDGSRWEWQADDAVAIQAAIATIRAIPEDNKALQSWRQKSLDAGKVRAAAKLASSHPDMRVQADHFDAHPLQLNTPGGVVDLATGAVTAPVPYLYHSKLTAATPAAGCPQWDAFLLWAMRGDEEMVRYLARLVGLSLLGEVRQHVLPFLYGKEGGNGKSVFLEVLVHALGDYAVQAPNNLLLAGPDRHPTELALLQGRRFVAMSEIEKDARFDESKLKSLTGGDRISARFMRGDFFQFLPSHIMWLTGNNKPKVETGGNSFWRRVRLIPFTNSLPEEQRDEMLPQKLKTEAAGILAWAIAGLQDYLQGGIQEPEGVRAATKEYAEEEDHLGRFFDQRVRLGGGEHVTVVTTRMREAYTAWCRAEGEKAMSPVAFGREASARFGVRTKASHGRRFYVGCAIMDAPSDDDEGEDRDDAFSTPAWLR